MIAILKIKKEGEEGNRRGKVGRGVEEKDDKWNIKNINRRNRFLRYRFIYRELPRVIDTYWSFIIVVIITDDYYDYYYDDYYDYYDE